MRITMGTTRICARFDGAAVRRDAAGVFVGRNASAADLADCSDASLLGPPTTTTTLPGCATSPFPECAGACAGDASCVVTFGGCACVSPSSPCGETSPVCSGACPAGEACVATDGSPLPGCGCLPVGATSCGATGAPTCGGACPGGAACEPFYTLPALGSGVLCGCFAPGGCGSGGADCPPGWACGVVPPTPTPSCFPILCTGTAPYPTCGGPCGDGDACDATPATGVACPPGEVCTLSISLATPTCALP